MAKNKELRAKIKEKGAVKAQLRREVKDFKSAADYWENKHAMMQEGVKIIMLASHDACLLCHDACSLTPRAMSMNDCIQF